MRSTAARTVGLIIGGLAVLVGGVWIGQGAGVIKESFMTGSSTWLAIGLLCLVVGLFLIFLSLRRRSGRGASSDRLPRP
jgi:F0F1-type ATP synthase assembly protein I